MEVQVISNKELHINEDIRNKEIRVIGADGDQLGIMTPNAAMMVASEKSLDLVMIAPQALPPVCRIMDYGKFRFEQAKKDKEAKKNQRIVDIKEIRMFMKIDVNDFNTKVNHAIKFLQNGDKVKVTVRFRGREMAHTELGAVLLDRFAQVCLGISSLEKPAKLEGRSMSLFLSAKATK
jgi:translation initiation factor IF-3